MLPSSPCHDCVEPSGSSDPNRASHEAFIVVNRYTMDLLYDAIGEAFRCWPRSESYTTYISGLYRSIHHDAQYCGASSMVLAPMRGHQDLDARRWAGMTPLPAKRQALPPLERHCPWQ
jgi:hypothetical protein